MVEATTARVEKNNFKGKKKQLLDVYVKDKENLYE